MSTRPDDGMLDDPGASDLARKRFQERLRAAGITPASEWEDRDDRVPVRAPFSLRRFLRSKLRIP